MAAMAEVRISLTEIDEVRALMEAAAVLLSTLGERGEIKSYDREPARLARELDRLHAALTKLAESR